MTYSKLLLAGVAFACAGAILSTSAGAQGDWIARLADADVALLGEIHDNPEHHVRQAEAIASLAPSAVVFEMLTPEQAKTLSAGVPDRAEDVAELLEWNASGWPDYTMYHPVFVAANGAAIYGATLPHDQVRAAVSGDITAIFGAGADAFGLHQPLEPSEQMAREAMQMSAHCDALPANMLPGMVAAQRLRDAHFSRVTLQALDENGGPVVVITGNGHARKDWGMPVYLAAAAPEVTVRTLGQFEDAPAADAPFDVTLVSSAAERPDPCLAFR
ncbi:ChaN family lipoprotein [Thalassobacter stenotrophicus]|uniref:ChaN family lipoprotein n=1 Tax=Thalassobacter stenotrophicus TaxID=266809 RepID=UPI0022A97B39|nr:ChaN family lipoprotein [Thalassobacter stenotrophicus]UYP67271.1 ChaN family lipoprotein [Thalassobacter stenotrophicus]